MASAASSFSPGSTASRAKGVVAIIPWGNCIEDFLDSINMSLDTFCSEMTGGWLFGYMAALQSAGVGPILYCYSRAVTVPQHRTHLPTGFTIRLLPLPWLYRVLARRMVSPYAATGSDAFGARPYKFTYPLSRLAFELAPYLAIARSTLARLLRADRCIAVLVQEYEDPRFDRIVDVGRAIGIPVFATFQGGDRHFRRLEDWTRPRAIAKAAGLIVASAAEAERVHQRYRPSCPVVDIPNPLDLGLWHPKPQAEARAALNWPAEARIAIYHGRIDIHRKGLDVLIAAWARVRQLMPDIPVRLVVIGDGPDREAFRALLRDEGSDTVVWISRYMTDRADMREALCAADVAVTTSRHEGFPVAPIEAMACGLPLVASDAPGLPEILSERAASGGILCPRDDVAAFAAALVELLSDPDKSRSYGRSARASVERRFGLEVVGRRLAEIVSRAPSVS